MSDEVAETEIPEPEPFEVTHAQFNTVGWIYSRRGEIDMAPSYQRQGAVWTVEKQRLLIDSLLNRFDIPKIYMHRFVRPRRSAGIVTRWALVDGKQRLEAIFGFLNGEFALSNDFVTLDDNSLRAAGLTFSELQQQCPDLAVQLEATPLDLMEIRTEELELVEEMFSRLNEAVPLNAAEKRNALGGPVPTEIRLLARNEAFFLKKLPFTNRRYRHYDLTAKFLFWAYAQATGSPVRDVKKSRLDGYVRSMKSASNGAALVKRDRETAKSAMTVLSKTFVDGDTLLSSVGMVSVYYLMALSRVTSQSAETFPARKLLADFEAERTVSKRREEDLTRADLVFLEFARLAQSPNDGNALVYRQTVLETWLKAKASGADTRRAVAQLYNAMNE